MRTELRHVFVLAAVLTCSTVKGSGATKSGAARTDISATRLRETAKVSFSANDWFAWVHPARCDADGNVFVIPVPEAHPRDAKNPSAPPIHPRKPKEILRISADGKSRTTFDATANLSLSASGEVNTAALVVGPSGTVYGMFWVPRGDSTGSHYIVSFRDTGQYKSRVEVDNDEMVVRQFEVFGSGAFLLVGMRFSGEPRVAVMPSSGGALQDVAFTADDSGRQPKLSSLLARGGDGRIYFVPEGDDTVHAIDASGLSAPAFRLADVPRTWQLVEVMAAGPRLALVYYEPRPKQDSGRVSVVVYDVRLGERVAVYGPLSGAPLCYEVTGERDQFTVLKDGRFLVKLAPGL